MSAGIKTGMANQEPHKSKRLSSFIWILVLWGGARLLSETSGTGWEKMFEGVVDMFGVMQATVLLFLAAMSQKIALQKIYRWGSLLVVLQALALILIFDSRHMSQMESDRFIAIVHWVTACVTALYSMFYKWSHPND